MKLVFLFSVVLLAQTVFSAPLIPKMRAVGEGVKAQVPLFLQRIAYVTPKNKLSEEKEKEMTNKLFMLFDELTSQQNQPAHFTPQAAVYRVRSSGGEKVWSSETSSSGVKTRQSILVTLNKVFRDPRTESSKSFYDCSGFPQKPGSFLQEVIIDYSSVEQLPKRIALYRDFLVTLEPKLKATNADKGVYINQCHLNSFEQTSYAVMFLDPTPRKDPDDFFYMVVIADGYSE